MNLCSPCGEDFASVRDFDAHRVGVHAYTYQEGLKFDPPVEDGRRCFEIDEMEAAGWTRNPKGRWRRELRTGAADRARLAAWKKQRAQA